MVLARTGLPCIVGDMRPNLQKALKCLHEMGTVGILLLSLGLMGCGPSREAREHELKVRIDDAFDALGSAVLDPNPEAFSKVEAAGKLMNGLNPSPYVSRTFYGFKSQISVLNKVKIEDDTDYMRKHRINLYDEIKTVRDEVTR